MELKFVFLGGYLGRARSTVDAPLHGEEPDKAVLASYVKKCSKQTCNMLVGWHPPFILKTIPNIHAGPCDEEVIMREWVWVFLGKLISELFLPGTVLIWRTLLLKKKKVSLQRMVVWVFHSTLKFHGLIGDDFGIPRHVNSWTCYQEDVMQPT